MRSSASLPSLKPGPYTSPPPKLPRSTSRTARGAKPLPRLVTLGKTASPASSPPPRVGVLQFLNKRNARRQGFTADDLAAAAGFASLVGLLVECRTLPVDPLAPKVEEAVEETKAPSPEAQSPKASPPRRDILRRVGSMTGSFHKPKEEAAGEPRESLAKRRARAKTMENLASGR